MPLIIASRTCSKVFMRHDGSIMASSRNASSPETCTASGSASSDKKSKCCSMRTRRKICWRRIRFPSVPSLRKLRWRRRFLAPSHSWIRLPSRRSDGGRKETGPAWPVDWKRGVERVPEVDFPLDRDLHRYAHGGAFSRAPTQHEAMIAGEAEHTQRLHQSLETAHGKGLVDAVVD